MTDRLRKGERTNFVLAFVIDGRMLRSFVGRADFGLAVTAIALRAYGEFDALSAIADSRSHASGSATAGAIAAGFAGVLVAVFGDPDAIAPTLHQPKQPDFRDGPADRPEA